MLFVKHNANTSLTELHLLAIDLAHSTSNLFLYFALAVYSNIVSQKQDTHKHSHGTKLVFRMTYLTLSYWRQFHITTAHNSGNCRR